MAEAFSNGAGQAGSPEQPTKCPVCESDKWRVRYESLRDRQFDLPGESRIWQCEVCGVWRLWPVPDDLAAHYPDSYTPHNAVQRRYVRRPWHGPGWGLAFSRVAWLRRLGLGLLHFNQAAQEMTAYLRVPPKSLLDYGCGSGAFVGAASQLGVDAFGVDVSATTVERATAAGIACAVGTYDRLPFDDRRFDVVRLSHVLEHVVDPVAALTALRPHVAESGRLVIMVPNAGSAASDMFGRDWYHLDTPRHLWGFSEKSLRMTLEGAGYEVEDVSFVANPHGVYESMRYALESSGSSASLSEPADMALVDSLSALAEKWTEQRAGDFMVAIGVVR